MYASFSFLAAILISFPALADNVILMVADGMGFNHIACVQKEKKLFLSTLPVSGQIRTHSANRAVTDSAAAATAYACGIKTKNGYVGMDTDKNACETIAEKSVRDGFFVGLLTTDFRTSPTPGAFYAHTTSRYKEKEILIHQQQAQKRMTIKTDVSDLKGATTALISQAKASGKPYFLLIEEEGVDTASHENDTGKMKEALIHFDTAVQTAITLGGPETTVIVLSDHETGNISEKCVFGATGHTAKNAPLFATGKHASLLSGNLDNTQINYKINRILSTAP